jgi:hypothetical protein
MIGCVLLVTLVNAKHAIYEYESASTAMKTYFKEEEWPLERALVTMGSSCPREALSLLRKEGRTGKSMLRSSTALMQSDGSKNTKGTDWTTEELDRARDIMNKMYDTEQAELDVLLVDCKKYLGALKDQMDENARVRTMLAENTATARAEQLESTKTKKEAEGQLEDNKEQLATHQASCAKTLAAKKAEYDLASADYAVALKIQNMSTCSDEDKAAAVAAEEAAESFVQIEENQTNHHLLACRTTGAIKGDDAEFFMFPSQQHQFHSNAGKFAMQRMAKIALMRKMGKHAYNFNTHHSHYALSLLEDEEDPVEEEVPGKTAMENETTTTTAVPPETPEDLLPAAPKCNVNAVPNCPLLNDAISTMVGELRDAFVKTKQAYESELESCNAVTADFESQIKTWETTHDRAEVSLAEAVTAIDTNQGEMEQKELEYKDMEKSFGAKMEDCVTKRNAILDTMCGIKVVRLELFKLAEQDSFFADCEVGDWVPQDCSVSCAGGTQLLTREILSEPNGGASCPPLQMEQECQTQPCPIDCSMDDWSGWSGCSKDCGGGIMSRSRNIEREPEFGGEECGATSDAQQCNVDACNVPCTLDDWTEWSDCSKKCNGGIEVRRKPELTPALGNGFCAHPDGEERFEDRPCNDEPCPDNLVCNGDLDVMMLMDGSGSVGAKGFDFEKAFVDDFISRFNMGDGTAKIGLILFSYYITIRAQMTEDQAALLSTVQETEWEAYNTNTAGALGTALEVLAAGGRESAQSVVVVITDGMPNDSEATAMMAEKVKEKARLIFVAVGKNLDMDYLYQISSFPPEMNVLTSDKFKTMSNDLMSILSDVCPQLACREELEGDGADYIGCQDVTKSGKVCQNWMETVPHKHKMTKFAKKGKKNLGDHNYCRNPDGSETIWCYTTDSTTLWEECVPRESPEYVPPEPIPGMA